MKPIIYYKNALLEYRVNTGQDIDLIPLNGLTYDFWEAPSAGQHDLRYIGAFEPANYIAIAGHNLAGTNVQLIGDGSVLAQTTPATNSPFVIRFPQSSRSVWEVVTNKTDGIAKIAVLQVGLYTELERGIWSGHSPFGLNRDTEYANSVSDAGQLLGRKIIRQGARGTIRVDNLSSDWVRDVWRPFALHAEKRGFFFQHNPDQYPDEVAYCWSTDNAGASNDRVGGPDNRGLMSAEIPVRALV